MPKKPSDTAITLISPEQIGQRIYLIRGDKVMLDSDLAALYRVTTGNLNLAVRRNPNRFPEDFMFQLTEEEWDSFDLAICKTKKRPRWPPHAAVCFHRARCRNALIRP